ncbi:MAG: type II toxin-antitoxin system MqsA family antitoxin [Treponema sp.]|jgi:YgiT-type zinc finger domain-containing protein|nr:type II toxin-antitoxin system MqsA family antitoxin [Treponema sp.]
MKCQICKHGEMHEGFTQVVLTRKNAVFVLKNVPALVCDDCSEYYLDEQTAQDIHSKISDCFSAGQEVAIIDYRQAVGVCD